MRKRGLDAGVIDGPRDGDTEGEEFEQVDPRPPRCKPPSPSGSKAMILPLKLLACNVAWHLDGAKHDNQGIEAQVECVIFLLLWWMLRSSHGGKSIGRERSHRGMGWVLQIRFSRPYAPPLLPLGRRGCSPGQPKFLSRAM